MALFTTRIQPAHLALTEGPTFSSAMVFSSLINPLSDPLLHLPPNPSVFAVSPYYDKITVVITVVIV